LHERGQNNPSVKSNSITTRKPAAARNSTHPQPFNPLVYLFIPLHLLAYLQHLPLQLVDHHLPSDATTGCLKNIISFNTRPGRRKNDKLQQSILKEPANLITLIHEY
jgi:hypothetical protein